MNKQPPKRDIRLEVKEVMRYLGIEVEPHSKVRADHLSKILTYLATQQTEEVKKTLSRLALRIGIDYTHIKRNYFDGLVAEGIISLHPTSRGEIWSWNGAPQESFMEWVEKERRRENDEEIDET